MGGHGPPQTGKKKKLTSQMLGSMKTMKEKVRDRQTDRDREREEGKEREGRKEAVRLD